MYHMHDKIIFTILAICSFYASATNGEYNGLQHIGHQGHNGIKILTKQQQQQREQQQILVSSSTIHQSSRNLKRNDDDAGDEDDDGESSSSSDDNKKMKQQQYALKNLQSCTPISQCELCHGGKRGGHSGCSDTGRRIHMKCLSPEPDSNEEVTLFTSCNRTSVDEEYLLVSFLGMESHLSFNFDSFRPFDLYFV